MEQQTQSSAALGVKQAFDAEAETIRRSHHLNDEGKQAELAEAYARAVESYNEAIERQEREAAERVRGAERDLFRVSPSSARAYREAYDRVKFAGFGEDRVVKEKELSDMLAYAEKVGDSQLADALFQVCVEDGLDEIAERYLSERPEKARKVQNLTAALESEQRVKNATGWARSYPIRRPPEINAMQSMQARR